MDEGSGTGSFMICRVSICLFWPLRSAPLCSGRKQNTPSDCVEVCSLNSKKGDGLSAHELPAMASWRCSRAYSKGCVLEGVRSPASISCFWHREVMLIHRLQWVKMHNPACSLIVCACTHCSWDRNIIIRSGDPLAGKKRTCTTFMWCLVLVPGD